MIWSAYSRLPIRKIIRPTGCNGKTALCFILKKQREATSDFAGLYHREYLIIKGMGGVCYPYRSQLLLVKQSS